MTYKDQFKPAVQGLVIDTLKELNQVENDVHRLILMSMEDICECEDGAIDVTHKAMVDMRGRS